MNNHFHTTLWKNFAAAIDMLDNIIAICPEEIWAKDKQVYYMSYHVTIFLDYYLTSPVKDFKPLLSYTLADPDQLPEGAVDDVLPSRFYSKEELRNALAISREKCKQLVLSTPADEFSKRWISDEEIELHGLCPSLVVNYTVLEILFYNLRHVQHHVGQLNLLLRQRANLAADWIALAE